MAEFLLQQRESRLDVVEEEDTTRNPFFYVSVLGSVGDP